MVSCACWQHPSRNSQTQQLPRRAWSPCNSTHTNPLVFSPHTERIYGMNSSLPYKRIVDPILVTAQRKLFWDERATPPAIDSPRFLLRVMDMGTWQMVRAMEKAFPNNYLIEVVKHAPCGALSKKSWNFWCLRLGLDLSYPDRFATHK